MTDAVHGSLALDPTVPNVARMYDFMLGGPPRARFDPFLGAVGVRS